MAFPFSLYIFDIWWIRSSFSEESLYYPKLSIGRKSQTNRTVSVVVVLLGLKSDNIRAFFHIKTESLTACPWIFKNPNANLVPVQQIPGLNYCVHASRHLWFVSKGMSWDWSDQVLIHRSLPCEWGVPVYFACSCKSHRFAALVAPQHLQALLMSKDEKSLDAKFEWLHYMAEIHYILSLGSFDLVSVLLPHCHMITKCFWGFVWMIPWRAECMRQGWCCSS
jgi:hypothetical protein